MRCERFERLHHGGGIEAGATAGDDRVQQLLADTIEKPWQEAARHTAPWHRATHARASDRRPSIIHAVLRTGMIAADRWRDERSLERQ